MIKDFLKIDPLKAYQLHTILKQSGFFISGIIMAKWGLSTTEIGTYEYWMFLVSTVSYFWVNGLIQEFLSRQNTDEHADKNNLFFGAFVLFSLLCSVLILVIHLMGWPIFKDILPVGLLILFIFLHVPSFLIEHILHIRKQLNAQISYGLFTFIGQLLCIIIPLLIGAGLKGIFYAIVIYSAIKFIYLLFLVKAYNPLHFTLFNSWRLILASTPFIGYYIISGSSSLIDGWIVQFNYPDQSSFAVYKYGARDLPILTTLAFSLGTGLVPYISRNLNNGLNEIKIRSARLMHISFPIAGILILSSTWIFPHLLNPSFAESAKIFNIYMLLMLARLAYPQTVLSGLGYSKFLLRNACLELVVKAAFSILLFQYIGLAGIAFGTVIANIFEKLNSSYFLYKKLNISVKQYMPVGIYTIYSVALIILFVLSQFIEKM
ncbi:MAG TPA: polysaccharide biosynthesis C-terminal domain-containing protein [Saprospiraceae bacterium]|nr:polysaccharide biosynthesis C-terminal domain-containing protein [Saprospiraceae bacterium]